MTEIEQDWRDIIHRCFRCGYCKFTHEYSDLNCPSYKKYRFETYSTGGRLWLAYAALKGDIQWSNNLSNVLYSCTTCGNCMQNCRFEKFNFLLVDVIEAARAEAVKNGICPEKQKVLLERVQNQKFFNPYGEPSSDNEELKKAYNLPETAEWVYFIGCTSNYRQKNLRDATLNVLKKANVNFTLINERCCCSPLIRTGQIDPINDIVKFNLAQIKNAGASKIITSCAGCYRTMKKDWPKFGADYKIEVYHTIELVKKLIDEGKIELSSEYSKTVTYHDPCHMGRHMNIYDIPRDVIKQIPKINLVEMKRNKRDALCCGAGGGVKIGYPDWSIEISKERLNEAKETGASILTTICPFCKTNLSDANQQFKMRFEILDLIEIIDQLKLQKIEP